MRRILSTAARRVFQAYKRALLALPHPEHQDQKLILACIASHGIPLALGFRYEDFKHHVLSFVRSMNAGEHRYRYSPSVTKPTLYASAYACLILSLFGEIAGLSAIERRKWADYFDSFQSPDDGLFRDSGVLNTIYENSDWWGARHLSIHMTAAYTALGHVPKYPFGYLREYKNATQIHQWLDAHDWKGEFTHVNDIDNQIMNIACALQYERDFRNDQDAGEAVATIQNYLIEKMNALGLWGRVDIYDPTSLSRAIQFAYHLYPVFFYDGWGMGRFETLTDLTLKTQNQLGGFGVGLNSSACEDIDSLYLLCRFSKNAFYRKEDVAVSVKRALVWMFSNQNPDGGFVFRRNEPLTYGHPLMSSQKNESAMFPTWFRVLAIAYALEFTGTNAFELIHCPGLQFNPQK
jgi:prenyltransferase beta subunit